MRPKGAVGVMLPLAWHSRWCLLLQTWFFQMQWCFLQRLERHRDRRRIRRMPYPVVREYRIVRSNLWCSERRWSVQWYISQCLGIHWMPALQFLCPARSGCGQIFRAVWLRHLHCGILSCIRQLCRLHSRRFSQEHPSPPDRGGCCFSVCSGRVHRRSHRHTVGLVHNNSPEQKRLITNLWQQCEMLWSVSIQLQRRWFTLWKKGRHRYWIPKIAAVV